MKPLTDSGRCRVPFEFAKKSVILKVTRYTTFNDVVHMLSHRAGIPKSSVKLYAVYESTYDIERKIGGAVRVLNIWRSWGNESSNFRFIVKRAEDGISLKRLERSPSAKAEGEIDQHLSQSYREAHSEIFSDNSRDFNVTSKASVEESVMNQLSGGLLVDHMCVSHANIAFNMDERSRQGVPAFENPSRKENKHNEARGKRALLAKYFNDLKVLGKRKSKKTSNKLGERQRADGAEVPEVLGGRHVEGREDSYLVPQGGVSRDSTVTSMANCRYHWERHSDSDTDTDSDMSDDSLDLEQETDVESGVSDMCSPVHRYRALDTAFVKSLRCSESDEGIDVTSITSSDLNTAFVADFTRKCVTHALSTLKQSLFGDIVNMFRGRIRGASRRCKQKQKMKGR